ncbi:2-hydroxyacid dehydrogenase [Jiella avicenniae]|uniref:Hydroxyacid dehydrogenase n=1 Tax=Jiella avicenniae TaxID=2907202 RepID=A0A9X1T6S6_9HYPH|nr:NAD(P)-dependent oxidoreductase [Jiella avicenniae]MCE7029680.1 hydroxyacid dehydrogenase [Jiella avicenniae]
MPTVFLTDAIDPGAERTLRCHATVIAPREPYGLDALADFLARSDVVVVRRRLPPGLLAECPRLRAAVRHGAGLDFIPVDEASRCGIAVTNVPGANADCVAEHAIGLALSLCRRIAAFDRGIREGRWGDLREAAVKLTTLGGLSAGIVGFGRIGERIAAICRDGFGMEVRAVARPGYSEREGVSFHDLDTVMKESDVVFLACPLTPQTAKSIGAAQLALIGPSGILVNIARGPIVDERALLAALREGTIAGAGLDVFEDQPLSADHELKGMTNVVMTPHVAGISQASMKAMSAVAVADTLAILGGERPRHLANETAWPAIRARWDGLDRVSADTKR